jgi:curved DNA-binding protein CbpA
MVAGSQVVAKFKNYYEVLGIPPRTHVRIIEEKYWEQAHELQRVPTRKAARRLSAINEAYEVLGTPHRRLKYDREYMGFETEHRSPARPGFLQLFVNMLGKPFRPD